MNVCIDVQYTADAATTACIGFLTWTQGEGDFEFVEHDDVAPAPYESGQFYKRELPYLLRAVERAQTIAPLATVVVDGYVWLDEAAPGLGAHLFDSLGGKVAVIGVAKTAFRSATAVPLLRGQSAQPLFVTAVGIELSAAVAHVRSMHGGYRVPTLLKHVDQLARGWATTKA